MRLPNPNFVILLGLIMFSIYVSLYYTTNPNIEHLLYKAQLLEYFR